MVRRLGLVLAAVLVCTASCGQSPDRAARSEVTSTSAHSPSVAHSPSTAPSPSLARSVSPSPTVGASTTSSPSCPARVPKRLSLTGEHGRAYAFAPLERPTQVTVEGEVGGAQAWSTSKVLVVAAFLATTADGDPDAVSDANRRLIAAALQRSNGDAVASLRGQIPGSPGRAMTAVLRSIGDRQTVAPDSLEGTMSWSLREQVRFMVALQQGKVVSKRASVYLLATMHPIKEHRWGLGTVDASSFKGGWLRQGRITRQMGLLDGYAVAISTDQGPVVRQTDGDSAHVAAMDDLAELLADRLDFERRCN